MARPPRFAEAIGALKPCTVLQIGDMDQRLRNRLWSAVHQTFTRFEVFVFPVVSEVWTEIFGWATDEMPDEDSERVIALRREFMSREWFIVYDIVQIAGMYAPLREALQDALNRGGSGYRFVGERLAPIVDDQEIREIETAQALPIQSVREHLNRALALLGDPQDPDYRNSIKESISAVEGAVQTILGTRETLGDGLKILHKKGIDVHPTLSKGLSVLYGYTSAADGIRHALPEEGSNAGVAEARCMLVTASAFVNLLIAKAADAGIRLP